MDLTMGWISLRKEVEEKEVEERDDVT